MSLDFDATDLFARIDILTRYSTYVILGAEESYGYLPLDIVRDKDGNASALAIAELFAFLKSSMTTPLQIFWIIYIKNMAIMKKKQKTYISKAPMEVKI